MKPGDLRRFKDNNTTRSYDKPGYVRIASKVFMVTEVDAFEPSAWVSFLLDGSHVMQWVYDFVLENSEPIDEGESPLCGQDL